MDIESVIYGSCSATFILLIALMLVRGKVSGAGLAIIGACASTAAWATAAAFEDLLPLGLIPILDALRLSAWLIIAVMLIGMRNKRDGGVVSLPFLLAIGFCSVVVGYEGLIVATNTGAGPALRLDDYLRVGLGVAGLLAAENLLRNAGEQRRRDVWPLCLGLGAIFTFELFLYSDRLMIPGADPILASGRGLVGILVVPLLTLAMARNREWRVDIHVSRTVVFHTAALVATGCFFVALAAAGAVVRELGGSWGPWLQLLTLAGAAVVLAAVIGSRDLRVQTKRLIARHFFSHRFDYRAEWLRFVDTVSQPSADEAGLPARIVSALAEIVDSPSGTLWCLQEGRGYVAEAGWNIAVDHGSKVSGDDRFIGGFRAGGWIQEHASADPQSWPVGCDRPWLAIPLAHAGVLIGFVVLTRPAHPDRLDWESFDLLRAAARQAASYLAEERSTRALMESRQLTEFSKRFVFVVHDMKNLASQLGLVVANARRYLDNPEFRADMLQTLEDTATRMNRLVAQVHAGTQQTVPQLIEPDVVIANLARDLYSAGTPIETRLSAGAYRVAIGGDQFRSVMSHLITNAREAAQSSGSVLVMSRSDGDKLTVDVIDSGPGMDDEFIRNEFFRPFRSSKPGGFGIGGYQTRELLRVAGAELEVISEKGVGTTMRMTFPVHREANVTVSAA